MPRVLLVDDDLDILESLVDILGERYEVLVARNGAEALRALGTGPVDAIVLDLMMPVMDGVTFLGEQRARGDRTPVIVASAVPDLAAEARALGVADHVAKPYRLDDLLGKLDHVIARGGTGGGGGAPRTIGTGSPAGSGGGAPGGGPDARRRARRPRPSTIAYF